MTPQRKRLQMLLLEEAIYKVKMGFNHKFLALRDVKKKVVAEINARLGQLKDINAQLAAKDGAAVAAAVAAGAGQGAAQMVVAGFASDLALKPEEQPEMREVRRGWGPAWSGEGLRTVGHASPQNQPVCLHCLATKLLVCVSTLHQNPGSLAGLPCNTRPSASCPPTPCII